MAVPSVPKESADHREYFRLDVTIAFAYRLESGTANLKPFPTNLNLSGSGLRITTKQQLPIGETLRLVLALPSESPIQALGEVKYARPFQGRKEVLWKIGVAFIQISEKDRGKIVAYLVKRQQDILTHCYV